MPQTCKLKPNMSQQDLFISGKWVSGYGRKMLSKDSASNEVIYQGSMASPNDVSRAVSAGVAAFPGWSKISFEERAAYLDNYKQQLAAAKPQLQLAISQETGKPLWESAAEVDSMINKIPLSIEAYRQRCKNSSIEAPNGHSVTRYKPHGAIAVLGPFNFPGHLPNGHIVPALLAGNTVIFKPSELTPLVGKLMAECFEKAGLPAGVFNLLQGPSAIGAALAQNEDIQGLLFTGSFRAGVALSTTFAKTPGKMLALEMGGNNPLVVSKVDNLHNAIHAALLSAFITAGQRCTCARRLIVIDSKEGRTFVEALVKAIAAIKVGYYNQSPEPFMGPLINEAAVVRLLTAQALLQAKGGAPLVKLEQIGTASNLVTPGLIDVTDAADLPDEEFFGPLLQLTYVPDLKTAIDKANQTKYGLSASLLSDKREEFDEFYRLVHAGVINWNAPTTGASSAAPFGGVGNSGNHRPSAFFAADYCAYPIASLEVEPNNLPPKSIPGVNLE